jgi:hypothetical protein
LRIYVFYQKCRYAKKTQISLDPKKYRYVGDIAGFRTTMKPVLLRRYQYFMGKGFKYNFLLFELQLALLPPSPTMIKGAQKNGWA